MISKKIPIEIIIFPMQGMNTYKSMDQNHIKDLIRPSCNDLINKVIYYCREYKRSLLVDQYY